MKFRGCLFLALCLGGISNFAQAFDRTGSLGLNYTLGPSFIVGGSNATDVSSVEPGVGAALQYGVTSHAEFQFDYDYIDADLHSQALTFGGLWHFQPGATWDPFAGGGIGFGKPFRDEGWGHFSLKLTGGLEKELTSDVSIAGLLSYQYVEGPDPFGSVHVIEPGIRLIYYFTSLHR